MLVTTLALATVLVAAPPRSFGPFGSARHPAVGPAAPVPGDGPEPFVPPAPEECADRKLDRSEAISPAVW